MPKPIITVKNLSKKYRIAHYQRYLTFRDILAGYFKRPFEIFKEKQPLPSKVDIWALKDITFDVRPGEVVGIIGKNGAGKTTLLKILSRITYPTEGEVRLRGRVGSLLEVGTGFHSELTGRENIYFNGSILGMKKREIDKKFDEIVDFSGVKEFLNTPVKRFSSGMIVRLAFSVAAHLDPEMLLVDEVLAVGDSEFQKKCLGKMKDVSQSGRTILFVSHNMAAIDSLCSRAILLDRGKIVLDADTETVISRYLDKNLYPGAKITEESLEDKIEVASLKDKRTVCLKEICLADENGLLRNSFRSDEAIIINLSYACLTAVRDLRITAQVVDEANNPVLTTQNIDDANELSLYQRQGGIYRSSFIIPPNTFGDNHLYISLHIEHPTVSHILVNKILAFDVEFQGYSNVQYGKVGKSFLRPRLKWDTQFIGQ